jgi:hypothetical protein
MDETKVTAHLPTLDVEIVRKNDPDEQSEMMTIRLRAQPSFKAMADHLAGKALSPASLLWMTPLGIWSRLWASAWMPLLNAPGDARAELPPMPRTGDARDHGPVDEPPRRSTPSPTAA